MVVTELRNDLYQPKIRSKGLFLTSKIIGEDFLFIDKIHF